jgi:hypothetical protein
MSNDFNNKEWLVKLNIATAKMDNNLSASIANMKQGVAMSRIITLMGIAPPESLEADEKVLDIMIKQRAALRRLADTITEFMQLEVLKEQAWKDLADSKEALIESVTEKFPADEELLEKLHGCVEGMRGDEDED